MRILIVEDDFVSRKLLYAILSPYGSCNLAIDGTEALKAFKQSIDEKNYYDLICLDIMMPEMDGHHVLAKIREMEKQAGILEMAGAKVIFTTALADFQNSEKLYHEQCVSYMGKPINRTELISKIKEFGLLE